MALQTTCTMYILQWYSLQGEAMPEQLQCFWSWVSLKLHTIRIAQYYTVFTASHSNTYNTCLTLLLATGVGSAGAVF